MPPIFNIVGRVRNGFDTKRPLPYQLKRSPGGCGATLISSKFAITANHCGWYVPWDSMAFVAGKYYKNMKPSDKYVQKRWVKKVYGNKPKIHGWHLPDLVGWLSNSSPWLVVFHHLYDLLGTAVISSP